MTSIKNLRVLVVPLKMGPNIHTSPSAIEQLLKMKNVVVYDLGQYFKNQNNDNLGMHYSFLIDIETKKDLTGTYLF